MSVQARGRDYRIGEVAELVGLTTRTIRYWEELGLLHGDDSRRKGSHRCYSDTDVSRLRELIRFRDLLGLSLEELVSLAEAEEARAALRDEWAETTTNAERARIIDTAIELVKRQLTLVEARRATLTEFADELGAKLQDLQKRRRQLPKSNPERGSR
jgi:MerR family transcriptional regulator, repressor of the yfmOP operon